MELFQEVSHKVPLVEIKIFFQIPIGQELMIVLVF